MRLKLEVKGNKAQTDGRFLSRPRCQSSTDSHLSGLTSLDKLLRNENIIKQNINNINYNFKLKCFL